MSDTQSAEFGKVYDKIDQVLAVVTETRLTVEKVRGDFNTAIAQLEGKVSPLPTAINELDKRVQLLEGQAKFNAGRKLAWASLGGTIIIIIDLGLTLLKTFSGH